MNKSFLKSLANDLIYSIAGLIAMNGVMQFFVAPYMSEHLSKVDGDTFLFFMALIGLMGSSFGSGTNYARMVISTKRESTNGDYDWFLLFAAAISLIVTFVGMKMRSLTNPLLFLGISLVMVMSVLRYYSDVEFRLSLHYRKFCLFYVLIAVGYALGLLLFPLHRSWIWVILLGETAAVLYVAIRGTIYRGQLFAVSSFKKQNWSVMGALTLSYLLSDFVAYADRILIPFFGDAGDSYVFYAATVVGKIMALMTTPLNGVIVGHLAKYKGKITVRLFLGILAGGLAFIGVMTGATLLASHVFVYLWYPGVYDQAKGLLPIANASQVFFFASNTMMVVVLRFAPERYQLYLGVAYAILFFALVVPAVILWGLWGMAGGLLLINGLKFCMISGMGLYHLKRKRYTEEW